MMEPTGMSWFPVAHRLADSGFAVTRVKGKCVKALRRYLSEHAKTDLADAHVLAAIPGFEGPELDPLHIPAPESHPLQRITKQRGRFQDAIAAAKRRFLNLIRWTSRTLERVLPDLGTRLSMACCSAGSILRRSSRRASLPSPPSSQGMPAAITLTAALSSMPSSRVAPCRRDLHRGHVDFAELQSEIAIKIDVVSAHMTARAELDRKIDALYAELQPEVVLPTIPGIDRRLAPVLFGLLHSADRFRSERHIRGFCGLFPRRSDSGGAERPRQRIPQGGNDHIKRALMLAADTARKGHVPRHGVGAPTFG